MIRRLAGLAAFLLVASAVLFAIGVSAENDDHADREATERTEASEPDGAHDEAAERAEAVAHDEESEEEVLGVDIESPATVVAVAVVSLALAAAVWLTRRRAAWTLVLVFALGAAVFDGAEALHQSDESRSGLVVLALVIALAHLAAAGAASVALRSSARAS